jgi:hypothetical protein
MTHDMILKEVMREEQEAQEQLEARYELRNGFLKELQSDENDWSFLVRLQVFVEAVLVDAIVADLCRPEMRDYVSAMSIGGQRGLIELAKTLKILSSEDAALLACLARTRNGFAHDIANIDRSLQSYVDSLDKSQRVALWRAVLSIGNSVKDWTPPDEGHGWTFGMLIRSFFWMRSMEVATGLLRTISNAEKVEIVRKLRASAPSFLPAVGGGLRLEWPLAQPVPGGGLLGIKTQE